MTAPPTNSTPHALRPSKTNATRRHRCGPRGWPAERRDEVRVGRAHPASVTACERDRGRVGRRREQRPVERSELDVGRDGGRDQHALPRLVDVVPTPRCVDRRVAVQCHHRVHRARATEPAAAHVRQRRPARHPRRGDTRERTTGQLDGGEEVPTPSAPMRPDRRADPPRAGRPTVPRPRSIVTPPRSPPNRRRRPPTCRSPQLPSTRAGGDVVTVPRRRVRQPPRDVPRR